MQRHLFRPFVVLILQIWFPFYFVVRVPTGWESASQLGRPLLAFLFGLCLAMLTLQAWIARRVALSPRSGVTQPTSYVLLAALHNAGFIPLPILERLAPDAVIVGMFFYLLAFNIAFWSLAVPIIRTGRVNLTSPSVKLNPPLIGLGLGFLVAITGLHHRISEQALNGMLRVGEVALDGALVALGGALAGIREKLHFDREHWVYAAWRMVLYPAAVLLLVALPWPGLSGPLGWGLRMMVVLEASSPPATNTLVVTRAMGTSAQLHYTGGMILFSYLVSLVTIPLFVGIAVAWFA